jgi:hypothetical protein
MNWQGADASQRKRPRQALNAMEEGDVSAKARNPHDSALKNVQQSLKNFDGFLSDAGQTGF